MTDQKTPKITEKTPLQTSNDKIPLIELIRSQKAPPKKTLLQTIRESKRPRPVLHYQVPPKIQPGLDMTRLPLGTIFKPLKLASLKKSPKPQINPQDGHPLPGRLKVNGVVLEKHEIQTVAFLLSCGHDVDLIPRSREIGTRTPDIRMQGLDWEIKCPKGRSRNVIKNTVQKATMQSDNIIIDLARSHISEEKCIREFERQLYQSETAQRMKIITKDRRVLDFIKPQCETPDSGTSGLIT